MKETLIGWKEISSYLRVSERTAIRYHKEKGLPITYDPAGHPTIEKAAASDWRVQSRAAA